MSEDLKADIESYLLNATGDGWVKCRDIASRFDMKTDRPLRKIGDRPGLATEFTISGNKGLKHIDRATPSEFEEYYARERQHNLAGLVTLRQKRTRRTHSVRTIKRPAFAFQKDNGQGVLL